MANYPFGGSRLGRSKTVGGVDVPYQYVATAEPTVVGCQRIAVTTTAATLASLCSGAAIPTGATHALFTVNSGGGDLRWYDDGTSPSSTVGLLTPAGNPGEWVNLASVKVAASTGTVNVDISFRRYDQ